VEGEVMNTNKNFILYTATDGEVKLGVFVSDETLWLSQKNMAELFDVDVRTVNAHLKNIFNEGELIEDSTIRDFRIVQKEGNRQVSREVAFYNLDAIIAVGYRVNSRRATQFRIWATNVLKEFIIKGFVLGKEIKKLERTISGFFDYIENITENRQTFTMIEFAESVNEFLDFNEYKILQENGSISKKVAEERLI
jgi:hypothetical protein